MNKKGYILSSEIILWIPRLVFLIVVVFGVLYLVNSFVSREIEIRDLEDSILINKLIYSENCLAYKDIRVYPGIIDIKKFNKETLEKCFGNVNFRIKLGDKEITSSYFSEENVRGFSKYILVMDEKLKKDVLKIELK